MDNPYRTKLQNVVPMTLAELKDVVRLVEAVKSFDESSIDETKVYDSNGDVVGCVKWDGDIGDVVFLPGD